MVAEQVWLRLRQVRRWVPGPAFRVGVSSFGGQTTLNSRYESLNDIYEP